jgi:hypothetical protein
MHYAQYTLCTMQCNIHYTLCTMQSTLYIIYVSLLIANPSDPSSFPLFNHSPTRFVDTSLLQLLGRPDKPCMIMEEEIDGVWEKYNGNSGYCSPQVGIVYSV